MSGFSIDWLNLREAADRRARDAGLLNRAKHWLESAVAAGSEATVVDLGAGTGATLRAFSTPADAMRLSSTWRLVDHDAELLAEAIHRHGDANRLETFAQDLTDIIALPLTGAHLVAASALFDLVSAEFLDTFAHELRRQCWQQPVGLYSALNYDGTTRWTPTHALDDAVLDAFNRDQRRDKGFGPALGPDAGQYLERLFTKLGFSVFSANSPWALKGDDQLLIQALIDGIGDAVAQDPSLDATSLEEWIQFRRAHALTGTCIVGHLDLLALPEVASW